MKYFSFFFFLIITNISFAQILPSSVAVHHKKTASISEVSYATLLNNGAYGQVTWSKNMSTYSVSMWVKSRDSDPNNWKAFFSTHNPQSDGFQIDSDGNYGYRVQATGWTASFGSNTIKTTWVHVAVVADGSTTKLYYNGSLSATSSNPIMSSWNGIWVGRNRAADNPGDYYLDEVRVWEDVALTQADIQAWMHKPLDNSHTNYSDLAVYFQMNSNSISGTTLLDVSGNSNNAQLFNTSGISNAISNVPVADLISSYQTDVEGIWTSTGTSDSEASDGLSMSVGSALAEANFVIFGNNNDDTGTTSSSLSGISKRSKREWNFDEKGTVTANIKIDISDATGHSGSVSTASNYKLLFKTCEFCNFLELETGDSKSGYIITFSSVAIQDGIYSIASADSNL